jgi:hypothetical protein
MDGRALALFAVLVAVAGNIAVFAAQNPKIASASDIAHQALVATNALCLQRDDLDRQISTTGQLLSETKGDPTIYNIPRQVIVETQRQRLITRRNLEILDCKERNP